MKCKKCGERKVYGEEFCLRCSALKKDMDDQPIKEKAVPSFSKEEAVSQKLPLTPPNPKKKKVESFSKEVISVPYESLEEIEENPYKEYEVPGGFWIRLGAFVIDYTAVVVILIILVIILNLFSLTILGEFLEILVILILFSYHVIALGMISTTPGKYLFAMRVGDESTGKKIGFGKAFIRTASYFISAIIFYYGFLRIAADDSKQGWHDKIAHTIVIRDVNKSKLEGIVLSFTAVFFVLFLVVWGAYIQIQKAKKQVPPASLNGEPLSLDQEVDSDNQELPFPLNKIFSSTPEIEDKKKGGDQDNMLNLVQSTNEKANCRKWQTEYLMIATEEGEMPEIEDSRKKQCEKHEIYLDKFPMPRVIDPNMCAYYGGEWKASEEAKDKNKGNKDNEDKVEGECELPEEVLEDVYFVEPVPGTTPPVSPEMYDYDAGMYEDYYRGY